MADDDEVGEVASKPATKRGQKMYPQDRRLRMVQAFLNGPWLNIMTLGLLLIMNWGLLHQNAYEKESFFNMVVGAVAYVFFMVETALKIWVAQGLWRQDGGYLRDNWNKVNMAVLCAETLDYILRVFGVDWRFSVFLLAVNMLCRDKLVRNMFIECLIVIYVCVCVVVLYTFIISILKLIEILVINIFCNGVC